MATNNAQNNRPIRDFVREMQAQFGKCEYRAVSSDGRVIQTPGFIDTFHMKSVCADFRGGAE